MECRIGLHDIPPLFAGLWWSVETAFTIPDVQKSMAASATHSSSTFWQHPCEQWPRTGLYSSTMPYFNLMHGDIDWDAMNQCAMGQSDDVSAAIQALYSIEESFSAKLAVLQSEFHQEIQSVLMKHLPALLPCGGCVTTATVEVCETTAVEEKVLSCSGCANTGMTWLAKCAH